MGGESCSACAALHTVERGTKLQPVSTTRPYSYVNHQDDEEMMVMMMMMVMMAMGMMVTMM